MGVLNPRHLKASPKRCSPVTHGDEARPRGLRRAEGWKQLFWEGPAVSPEHMGFVLDYILGCGVGLSQVEKCAG